MSFFLIDCELAAIRASALDVHFYGLYKRRCLYTSNDRT